MPSTSGSTTLGLARWLVPVWFGLGIYLLGWGDVMQMLFPPTQDGEPISWMGLHSPTVLLGLLPGILTWMGLWWAYVEDRIEQAKSQPMKGSLEGQKGGPMAKARHYSPQIRRDLVTKLYFRAKAENVPMTQLTNRLLDQSFMEVPAVDSLKVAESSHTSPDAA